MSPLFVFAIAAALLSIERVCYIRVWRRPEEFRAIWRGLAPSDAAASPVDGLRYLFYSFKALQLGVFAWWCWIFGSGSALAVRSPAALAAGAALTAAGQALNIVVFKRLGRIGVFYGNRFGYSVPWVRQFPFSVLKHPQYAGALLSIWGLFLMMRFPGADWWVLPVLETIYYAIGATIEQLGGFAPQTPSRTRGAGTPETPTPLPRVRPRFRRTTR